jgi:arabinogalactan endo-1,4-beta-galactosidase
LLPPLGADLLFLVNNPHCNHDGGSTPYTQAGVRAFASYTAEVLRRFPEIGMVEVGNEMNSATFAWGPGWQGSIEERAASYVRLLAATSAAVRAERPDVTVLGGAAHSIPIAWFREIFLRGGPAHIWMQW